MARDRASCHALTHTPCAVVPAVQLAVFHDALLTRAFPTPSGSHNAAAAAQLEEATGEQICYGMPGAACRMRDPPEPNAPNAGAVWVAQGQQSGPLCCSNRGQHDATCATPHAPATLHLLPPPPGVPFQLLTLRDLTFAQLQSLELGGQPGLKVPSLQQFLE